MLLPHCCWSLNVRLDELVTQPIKVFFYVFTISPICQGHLEMLVLQPGSSQPLIRVICNFNVAIPFYHSHGQK